MIENNYKLIKCLKCNKFKCEYYNYKTPYLHSEICNYCFGRKEISLKVKPELYRIYGCSKCINDNYLKNNFKCDMCSYSHDLCLCIDMKTLCDKYPYNLPY